MRLKNIQLKQIEQNIIYLFCLMAAKILHRIIFHSLFIIIIILCFLQSKTNIDLPITSDQKSNLDLVLYTQKMFKNMNFMTKFEI